MNFKQVKCRWKKAFDNLEIPLSKGMRSTINLWKRNKGICHICGQPVPHPLYQWKQLTESNYPSRDHVIPRSKQGAGLQHNILLAHRKCNLLRGNTNINSISDKIRNRKWMHLLENEQ